MMGNFLFGKRKLQEITIKECMTDSGMLILSLDNIWHRLTKYYTAVTGYKENLTWHCTVTAESSIKLLQ